MSFLFSLKNMMFLNIVFVPEVSAQSYQNEQGLMYNIKNKQPDLILCVHSDSRCTHLLFLTKSSACMGAKRWNHAQFLYSK